MDKPVAAWIREEIAAPAAMGEGRNDQMIRIGPSMIRAGFTVPELYEVFCQMFSDCGPQQLREIEAVCRNCVKYAAREDREINKGEWMERRKALNRIGATARQELPQILADFCWPLVEIMDAGGTRQELPVQRWEFLNKMFVPTDTVWIGQVWETGIREKRGRTVDYSSRFKTIAEWLTLPQVNRGEFVSHCTFQPGTSSRCNEAVAEKKFMVVESDVLDFDEVGAVFNYLANHQGLTLRAIVSTGGKSIHGWFDWPDGANDDRMDEWSAMLEGLRCDPSTLRPSQPVRLPGIIRRDSQRLQELLWLA